ncbi:MAG: CHAT domain-containing protein [Stigonema ocellatum SAG 48.90 = DSM 106950]|nr:CHAT domain-containing protein [Stigonema ocellatum SAG 48.90 = DSM 106950]
METLELYLSPRDAKGFKAIVTKSPAGEGETQSSLPFFEGEKDWRTTVLRCLEVTSFKSEHFDPEEQEWMVNSGILNENRNAFDAKYLVKIGQQVYQSLFPADSKAKNALLGSLRFSEEKKTQLHIQLKFAAERSPLADYPWELLHDGKTFLLHYNVTISRYIAYDSVPPKLPPTVKVNVLLVSSAAWDSELGLKQLGEQETQAIRQGLEKARDAGHINFVQEDATKHKLTNYLTEHRGEDAPHVLHFDGHGLFGKRCSNPKCRTMHNGNKAEKCRKCDWVLPEPQGYLVFEDADKKADYVSAEELGVLLYQSSLGNGNNKSGGIALVVLSACQSAMALDGDSVFNGTAQNLISHRIPSVVAMQYSVSVVSATKFAEQFYRSLGQKNSLGIAMSQAREVMGIGGEQWYRPVLYLRWEDNEGGQLFKDSSVASSVGTDEFVPQKNRILEETNKPRQISRITQIQIDSLKKDLKKLEKDYQDVADKKRRESNPQEQNNLELQLKEIAKKMEEIEQEIQEVGL